MAKNADPKIVYSEDGLSAKTTTFVTVENRKFSRAYEYPVLRLEDLTPEAKQRLVQAFPSEKSAAGALEFGPRNRLAGIVSGKVRARLVAPSENTMVRQLNEAAVAAISSGDTDTAVDLANRIQESKGDELVELWREYIQQGESGAEEIEESEE